MKKILLILFSISVYNLMPIDLRFDNINIFHNLMKKCANGKYNAAIINIVKSFINNYTNDALTLYVFSKDKQEYHPDNLEVLELLISKSTPIGKANTMKRAIFYGFSDIVRSLIKFNEKINSDLIINAFQNYTNPAVNYTQDEISRFIEIIEFLIRNCDNDCILQVAQTLQINEFAPVVDDPTGIKLIFKNEILARLSRS